jgi:hypothetical protein
VVEFRIEAVDPAAFAEAASGVLSASWPAPCLHYSPEYVAWQIGFPGELRAKTVMAFAEEQPVGCAAVTPRTFLHHGQTFSAYVLSFIAVAPIARGHRLGDALYRSLLNSLPFDVEVIAFAESGSTGERLLTRAFRECSFDHLELESCRAVGCRPGTLHAEQTLTATAATYEDFIGVVSSIADSRTILNKPSRGQWIHYCADPRTRAAAVVSDRYGDPVAAAMIVNTEVISGQGIQTVPMLESICIRSGFPEGLRELFRLAAVWTFGNADGAVIASNITCVEPSVVKSAGARALPSLFSAHLFMRGTRRRLDTASRVNIEVT